MQPRPAPEHRLRCREEGPHTAPGMGKAGEVCLSRPWFSYPALAKPGADVEGRGTPLTWLGVPRGGRGAFLFLGVLFFSLTDDWLGEDVCKDTKAEGISHLRCPPSFLTHRHLGEPQGSWGPPARGWGQP